jgi:peptidoglycan/LPS O-acetylase OafA/YrhL
VRNPGLDILRLVAVLLVLARHIDTPDGKNKFIEVLYTGGWVGVDLFFVLSGFLVSGLLFKEYLSRGAIDLPRFLIRRALKIYPAFYVLILFSLLAGIVYGEHYTRKQIIAELLFLQNYLDSMWNHTWSLAVEEHFYIFIALAIYVLMRIGRMSGTVSFDQIPLLFCLVFLVAMSCRLLNLALFDHFSYNSFLFWSHIRFDSLMFGVLISYYWHFGDLEHRCRNIHTGYLLGVGMCLLLPAFFFPVEQFKFISVFGVVLFYLGSGALLVAAMRLKIVTNKLLILCAALGASSYSIYLWHMPVKKYIMDLYVNKAMPWGGAGQIVAFVLLSLAVGWLMSKLIEFPVLRIRDRWLPSRRAGRKHS